MPPHQVTNRTIPFHNVKEIVCVISDLSCVIEVDHYGQFVRKAKTRTCKATTDPVWDQVRAKQKTI